MASCDPWAVVTILGAGDVELGRTRLAGDGAPDVGVVDDIGRLALLARRLGGRTVLSFASRDLLELVELAGLPVELEWEPELGKEALGVEEGEEEGHVGHLPA
jgi:hypothetical protein